MPTLKLTLPRPHPAQAQIIKEARGKRFKVVCNGRRWGKSILGIDRVTPIVSQGYPVGWFASTDKVLDDAWRQMKMSLYPIITYKNEVDHRLEFISGGSLEMWSLKAGLVARSRKYKRVVIDEAAMPQSLKDRWQYEIRPTLTDLSGDAWFLSTPQGLGDFKDLWDLGQGIDPRWISWQMPSWTNPHLPEDERAEMQRLCGQGDRAALQEYGAEFVASEDLFVPPMWVDACASFSQADFDRARPIIVGIDAASANDTFALVGIWRDWQDEGRFKTAFVKVFEPQDLIENGITSFRRPKEFAREVFAAYHVVAWVYDPFQMVDFAGSGMEDGLGLFQPMQQGQDRLFADRHFYELIRDRRFEYEFQAHSTLAQHIKNANAKLSEDKLRMIKRKEELKIDAAVAASMACYAAAEWYNI